MTGAPRRWFPQTDSTFGNAFLAGLPPATLTQVIDRADVTATALRSWAVPPVRTTLIPGVSLVTAATARDAGDHERLLAAQICLWTFAVDDLFDEGRLTFEELQQRCHAWQILARHDHLGPPDDTPLSAVLLGIVRELRRYPLFPALRAVWAEALTEVLTGMLREHRWRDRHRSTGTLPSLRAYRVNGMRSIGGPICLWTVIAMLGDPSVPHRLGPLRRLERAACLAIRLANDLRTHEREAAQGDINAVTLHYAAARRTGQGHDRALSTARANVLREMRAELDRCAALRPLVATATGAPEALLTETALFACSFYAVQDVRDFGPLAHAPSAH
ncbi:terpene synthase family protein [Streptomyces sp. NPDC002537]